MKIVLQIHPINLFIIGIYNSVKDAANNAGIELENISNSCLNRQNHAGGYYYIYLDDLLNKYNINKSLIKIGFNLSNYIQPCFTLLPGEILGDIPYYEKLYQVSNYGRIISLWNYPYIKLLNCGKDKDGYCLITLHKNKNKKTHKVHRLVAQAFIPNPLNFPCINHKNEIKTDNRVGNLEWCDHLYNNKYGSRNERVAKTLSKPVKRMDKTTGKITMYNSIREASILSGINDSDISAVCLNKHKTAGGSVWKYLDKFTPISINNDINLYDNLYLL